MDPLELAESPADLPGWAAPADQASMIADELTPEQLADQAAAADATEREAQLQRLLQRMQRNADFPSLRESIRGVQSIARSETAHLRSLTDLVLGDVALSNKLLRMINTAFYSSVGGGTIDSLSRAVSLIGFAPVAMLASSLTMFDKLPKGPDGARVQKEFGRALLAAMLANQFCPVRRLEESAYIVALFQNLGTMLGWMHFAQEAAEIEAVDAQSGAPDHDTLQQASRKVLGIGYEDLSVEVARTWGWPESLQLSLRRLEPADRESAVSRDDYLRVVCTAANRLALELETIDGDAALESCLEAFRLRYGIALSLPDEELPEMVERARSQWSDLALVLGIAKQQPRARAKPARPGQPDDVNAARSGSSVAAERPAAHPPAQSPRRAPPTRRSDPAVAVALSSALDTLSQRAMSEAPLAEVMHLVMDLLRKSMRLQRVIICLRDGASGELVGRFGVGDKSDKLAKVFRIPMQPPTDLFGILCLKHADTLISDTTDPIIVKRLPAWYQQQVDASCFVLLPLAIGQQPVGLIYGDCREAHSLSVNDNELTLLKALRNQLVMAMRLRGVSS